MVFAPYIHETTALFTQQKEIAIHCNTPGVSIHYNLNGTNVSENDPVYTGPFKISETKKVMARAFKEGMKPSELLSREFIRAHFNSGETYPSIQYNLAPSRPYDKAGEKALIDGYRASMDFHDGQWLGFNRNMEAIVNLGAPKKVEQVRLSFMRNVGSWILLPRTMTVYGSNNNQSFTKLGAITTTTLPQEHEGIISEFHFPVNASFQYFKISAEALPLLPDWHPGAGNRPWIFADEIIFEY
nr:chitobiase/beta-hexosaminidase C-terminal domain-containing protein [Geofilum rubicundum]